MRRYKENQLTFKKIILLAAGIFAALVLFSQTPLFSHFLLYVTMPYYTVRGMEPLYFDFQDSIGEIAEVEAPLAPSDIPGGVENDVEVTNGGIIGISDVIYQDEEEFRPLIEDKHKENISSFQIDRLMDANFLISSFYNMDNNTGIVESYFDAEKFLAADLYIEKSQSNPQVLIFHTHAGTEFFIDSDTSNLYEGVVGAGSRLQYILENKYGINAMHHTGVYDMVAGESARSGSYERMEGEIQAILAANPSIELVIDLHRDGIEPDPKLVTYIDGKPHAKMMFVNGLSTINEGGRAVKIDSLPNPYLTENLALSFNMQLAANSLYPDITRKIYLKAYRFSTFMRPKSLLVEAGCQYNTKEEVFNSMEVLADLIQEVVFTPQR